MKSDLPGLTSGGWQLNPHGHLKKVRALWTSSGISLPVGVPPHLLFVSHHPPRITLAACLAECLFLESGVVFATLERGWLGFVGVLDEPDTSWQAGTAVTRSTKDAGQLAEQLGGPRRDSPSNSPLRKPHRLGTIWFGRKTWFVAMLSISCWKEQVTCRMVLNRALTCSGGTCSLARPTSWAWMFRKASLVCHLATAKAAARSGVARGKTEVRWDSCSCSLGMNSSMVLRASFPACRASASS